MASPCLRRMRHCCGGTASIADSLRRYLRVYVDVGRLRLVDSCRRLSRTGAPAIRTSSSTRSEGVVRQGARLVEAAGPARLLARRAARRERRAVTDRAGAGSVDVFVVGLERHDRVRCRLADRATALAALEELVAGPGWLLDWEDGGRSGTVAFGSRVARHRHVRSARTWRIYRVAAWGDQAVGREQAAELGFWQAGTSGQSSWSAQRHERFEPEGVRRRSR